MSSTIPRTVMPQIRSATPDVRSATCVSQRSWPPSAWCSCARASPAPRSPYLRAGRRAHRVLAADVVCALGLLIDRATCGKRFAADGARLHFGHALHGLDEPLNLRERDTGGRTARQPCVLAVRNRGMLAREVARACLSGSWSPLAYRASSEEHQRVRQSSPLSRSLTVLFMATGSLERQGQEMRSAGARSRARRADAGATPHP